MLGDHRELAPKRAISTAQSFGSGPLLEERAVHQEAVDGVGTAGNGIVETWRTVQAFTPRTGPSTCLVASGPNILGRRRRGGKPAAWSQRRRIAHTARAVRALMASTALACLGVDATTEEGCRPGEETGERPAPAGTYPACDDFLVHGSLPASTRSP